MSTVFATTDLQPGLLSVEQACRRLGISTTTGYRLIDNDEFPVEVITVGARRKVRVHQLEQFLRGEEEAS